MCKFPAGAFFTNAGILFYLYVTRVSAPILGMSRIETPEISGARSIVHAVLFLTFFYLGFVRKSDGPFGGVTGTAGRCLSCHWELVVSVGKATSEKAWGIILRKFFEGP